MNTKLKSNLSKKVITNGDWADKLSNEQKFEIEQSIAELERGEGIPHEQVMKQIKTKYKI